MADRTAKEIEVGFIVDKPGGAKGYRTGDWRSMKPSYDKERCIKCGVCYMFCPDAAIGFDSEGFIQIDEFYCKGCGICSKECVTGAFKMVPLGSEDKAKKK
jgi:pyruvate ferredoxin oxidoreductase delta subunit